MAQTNRYLVIREDLVQDPVTIITEGLLIGRLHQCELLLNHPAVSRVQAGLKQIEGDYYVFNLRSSNPAILNGKPVEGNQALAPGDVLEIGPFKLDIDVREGALLVEVSLRIGMVGSTADSSNPELATIKLSDPGLLAEGKKARKPRPEPIAVNKALDIFWDKRIREAGKMVRPSPLFPKSQRRSGKAQYNWIPTTDLASRWPLSFFIWGAVLVGVLALAAAFSYTSAYAPAPVARAHAKSELELFPPIAARPNANACTSCHSFTASMETRCSSCHQTEVFAATVISPHVAAGIGCVSCHAEHRGTDFRAGDAALITCTECHNDANREIYNGRKVGTPHGGTLGYPVVNGKWKWRGLDENDWALKQITITRLPVDSDEQWRSNQFHALHVQRVKSSAPLPANVEGQLSCSSCHKSFDPIDRETPRMTCGACHNGKVEPGTNRVLIASNQPNCTSCHVQHVKDKRHWNPGLLAAVRQ
ncbi:MAG: FHA domain-containing protein [Pyrinomonadaceae bacterium]